MDKKIYHVTFHYTRMRDIVGSHVDEGEFEAYGTRADLDTVAKVWIETQKMKHYPWLSLYAKGDFYNLYADC